MMDVIITADDYGWFRDDDCAIEQCLLDGHLTSASIMANAAATEAAVEFALKHPRFSYGVHLAFAGSDGERPVVDPVELPHMTGPDGCFLPQPIMAIRSVLGLIPRHEIALEATAQIEKLRARGVPLSFANSHGHLHRLRGFEGALRDVLRGSGIRAVRRNQDVWVRRPSHSPAEWVRWLLHPRIAREFATTSHLFMPTCDYDRENMNRVLQTSPGRSLELGVHPGIAGWRDAERRALPAFIAELQERGHRMIGWKELNAA